MCLPLWPPLRHTNSTVTLFIYTACLRCADLKEKQKGDYPVEEKQQAGRDLLKHQEFVARERTLMYKRQVQAEMFPDK